MFPLALLNRSAPSIDYKLLLYFEGADGSTTFVDSSSYNRSFQTSPTPPTISTDQSQSGTSSLLLIGWPSPSRSLRALIPNDGIGITTTKTWTIEGYVRLSNVTHENAGIVGVPKGVYPYFTLYYGVFRVANTTVTGWQSETTFDGTLLSTTSFTKVKITGDGVSIKLYLDDALILSVAYPNWPAAPTTPSDLFLGGDTHTQGGYYDNWIVY